MEQEIRSVAENAEIAEVSEWPQSFALQLRVFDANKRKNRYQ